MSTSVSVDRGGRIAAALECGLDIAAGLFLPVLALVPHGAAPLAAVAGLLGLGLAWPARWAGWPRGLAGLFAVLLLWGMLSALWAVDPPRTLLMAARLAGLFAAGVALIAAAPRIAAPDRLLWCLGAGLAVALVLAMIQWATQGMLTQPFIRRPFVDPALNQVENGLVVLLLPLVAMLLLRRRFLVAAVAAAAMGGVVFRLVGEAGHAALVLGVAGGLLLYLWRGPMVRSAAAISAVVILGAPLLFPPAAGIAGLRHQAEEFKFSAWHRLEIWSFVGARIAERPLFGWGLDSSRAIPGGSALIPQPKEAAGMPRGQYLPLHPHNAPLQLWLELGVPGAALFALFAARVWLALGAAVWPRLYIAASGGSLVAGFVVALGAYGIWEEWWIASEFLALFLILVMARLAGQPMPDTRSGSIS
jgi:exopolysaccharide production protein ExoQ